MVGKSEQFGKVIKGKFNTWREILTFEIKKYIRNSGKWLPCHEEYTFSDPGHYVMNLFSKFQDSSLWNYPIFKRYICTSLWDTPNVVTELAEVCWTVCANTWGRGYSVQKTQQGCAGVLSGKVSTGMCGPDRVPFRPLRFTNGPFFIWKLVKI